MTDPEYIAAYLKLTARYDNNQSTMAEHLAAVQKLKDQYLKGRTDSKLPVVP